MYRVMTEPQFLREVGVSLELMPNPGKAKIHVSGEALTKSYAIRALQNLGYEVTTDRIDGCYELVVRTNGAEVVFLRDWINKYVQPDIERIVRSFERIGMCRREALFHLASCCVKQQPQANK